MEESKKVDSRIRSIDGKIASTELVKIRLSDDASASMVLADAESATVTVTLINAENLRLFAIPQMTFYVGSVATANIIYSETYDKFSFLMFQELNLDSSDGNNVVLTGFIQNISGSSQTILVRANWRFMIESV